MSASFPLVAFAANCLKFTAVPAGLFEVLHIDTRTRIDAAIERGAKLGRQASGYATLLVVAAVPIALLVGWSVYLAGVILFALLAAGYIAMVVLPARLSGVLALAFGFVVAYFVCLYLGMGALWWFESGMTPSKYSPYLWIEKQLMSAIGVTWSFYAPDQSFADLLTRRADLHTRVYGSEDASYWSLSFWLDFGRFIRLDYYRAGFQLGITHIAAGLFVVVFIVLNFGAVIVAVSVPVWAVSELIHRLYRLLNALKARVALQPRTWIPIGAAILWSLGETISFGLSIRETFW